MTNNVTQKIKPFLRWAGGKRWLSSYIRLFSERVSWERYVEPFLGGGSVFFQISPKNSLLSDSNHELINAFLQVKRDPDSVERMLGQLPVSLEQYYSIRSKVPINELDRAVRFIYLNRTCFNGIWRTNRKGQFNVPYGQGTKSTNVILGNGILQQASQALKQGRIVTCDFKKTLSSIKDGDLIYCDPAYTVAHENNSFLRYNEKVFSWQDQLDLHDYIISARDAGGIVVLSNAAHESIFKLYHPYRPIIVERSSSVGVKFSRGKYHEYIYVISPNANDRRKMHDILNKINRG